ncbi:MAG TPA: DUF4339 domain-containing protein [Bdellovibrionota bacterium]|nr:DUF4339 domain-containing protein [Bdellovibrionota bacterium]
METTQNKSWFIHHNGKQEGPFSREQIEGRLAAEKDRASILAWCEGMQGWKPVAEIDELRSGTAAQTVQGGAPKGEVTAVLDVSRRAFAERGGDSTVNIDVKSLKQAEVEAKKAETVAARARFEAGIRGAAPKSAFRSIVKMVMFVGFLAGLWGAYEYGGFEQKILLMRFPKIADIAPGDYEHLKSTVAVQPLTTVSLAMALTAGQTESPIMYLASNQPDETGFEVRVNAIPTTLLNASNASVTFRMTLKDHLAVSAPLRLRSGEIFPAGRYKIEIYSAADTSKDRRPLLERELSLLGLLSQDAYEAKRKEIRDRLVAQAMAELNDWSALGRSLSETISECERAFKEAVSIPIAKKKVVFWKKSEPRWQTRAKIFTERFGEKHGPWTAEAMKKRYLYPAILLEAREIWRSVEKFRAAQDSAFVSGKLNKKPAVALTEFTQAVVRERNLIESLKTSIRKAEDSLKDASIPPPEKAPG